ncbi:MAG TPA: gamma-glutamylcyclotransferase [Pseudomonadales bacterium]|nr:gamma-glutamylcyclotransferase [Pseudomonadales bacterium]
MNIREWNGRCQECYEESSSYTMSMYSTALVCLQCKDKETRRPDYKDAVAADEAEIRKGNFNFEGIGKK